MVAIAAGTKGNYNTSIPDDEWQSIADTVIFCLENDVQFLHIPQVIKTMELDNGWKALEYTSDDVTAVQDYVGN